MKCNKCGGLMAYEKFWGTVEFFLDGDALPVEKSSIKWF